MQLSTFSPIRFGVKDEQPKTGAPGGPAPGKQRYIIMLKDEALESIGDKAKPELQEGLKKAGIKKLVARGKRGLLKILVSSKRAADALKKKLDGLTIPGLEKTQGGTLQFRTTLPEAQKSLTKYGFPERFPLPVVVADQENQEKVYR